MNIAVYGANGYQAKLVVAELARRTIDTLLVGRSANACARLQLRGPGGPSTFRSAGLFKGRSGRHSAGLSPWRDGACRRCDGAHAGPQGGG
jgi:hypothetical protein